MSFRKSERDSYFSGNMNNSPNIISYLFLCLVLTLGLLLVGCPGSGDDDDDNDDNNGNPPTWESDIKDILTSGCATCHTNPAQNGAPNGFRLDKYSQSDGDDDWDGAFEKRDRILVRAVQQLSMPPAGPLPEVERDLINDWIEAGAPRD